MLKKIKRRMLPITISRGLTIVQKMSNPDSNTDKWYENAVHHFLAYHEVEDMAATDVTYDMVRLWSNSMDIALTPTGEPYSEWTKHSYRRAIRAFFNKLVALGHLDPPGPVDKFRVPDPPAGQPRHLSPDEVEAIRKAARPDARDHALIEVMHSTGCRISEFRTMQLSNLQIQEIVVEDMLDEKEKTFLEMAREAGLQHMLSDDLAVQYRGKILIIGKGQRGKKKMRWVFLDDTACRALKAYVDSRPADAGDKIWCSYYGRPLSQYSYYPIFKAIFKKAGVNCRPHDLRHTFAYRLIRNGADVKIVQTLLGHSDPTTTLNIYYNLSDDEMWDAYNQFNS